MRVHPGFLGKHLRAPDHLGDALALEHTGDVHSCDHDVQPEILLELLDRVPRSTLVEDPRPRAFRQPKRDTLTTRCRPCPLARAVPRRLPQRPHGGERRRRTEARSSLRAVLRVLQRSRNRHAGDGRNVASGTAADEGRNGRPTSISRPTWRQRIERPWHPEDRSEGRCSHGDRQIAGRASGSDVTTWG